MALCKPCTIRQRNFLKEPDLNMPTWISVGLTEKAFGYNPFFLMPQSSRKVVALCSSCGKERIIQRGDANRREKCIQCRGREKMKFYSEQRRIFPNTKLQQSARSKRRWLKAKANVIDVAITRISSQIRAIIKHKRFEGYRGGIFRHLGYNRKDLLGHIAKSLPNGCVICGEPIVDRYHIAHLEPKSCATKLEDVFRLFQLDNLSVAHPICNIKAGAIDLRFKLAA